MKWGLLLALVGPPEPTSEPEVEPTSAAEHEPKPKQQKKKKKRDPNDPNRLEWGVLPAVSYDIDLGLGFGAVVTLAKFKPGYTPYRWRLEILANATVKRTPGLGYSFPFHDDYIKADIPGLWKGRLRINAQFRFRRFANQGWYGLGNASILEEPWADIDPDVDPEGFRIARGYHQYDRIYPILDFNNRIILWDRPRTETDSTGTVRKEDRRWPVPTHKRRLEALVGVSFAYNAFRVYEDSKLEQDLEIRASDTPDGATLRRLMHGVDDHAVMTANLGLLYDTRDHEYTPTHGSFTELSTRLSPGIDDDLQFAQLFFSTTNYQPLFRSYLVLASRVAFDWLFGRPPFYELAQFGVLTQRDGPGGSWSIRGVPRQRYFGKQKAIASFELRSMLYRFDIKTQRFGIGALAFVDMGRVWTDYRPVELGGADADGDFFDIKVGVGGGLRITWGETLVIRVDPAYSPTDRNFGFYVDIGQMF
ncbi:MAG: BamA/TamA family outer membrane protein [Deltaproteobacteria bacterium]|nr:BamA/TamA family outer membrane protein [Deltaproteobacteria bacterium]